MAIVHAAVIAVDDDDVRTVFNPAPIIDAVAGPDSATDGHIAVFSGSTGKIIADGGAPGGGGLLQVATVTLTDAQIKALPTTPVVVIPATEVLNYEGFPTQIINVISSAILLDASSGAYTNINGVAQFILAQGSDWSLTAGRSLHVASTTPFWALNTGFNANEQYFIPFIIGNEMIATGGLQDNAIAITASNESDGNFTGGNAANTMKVIVYYTVVDVS